MDQVIHAKPKKLGFWAQQADNFRKTKTIIWFLIPVVLLVLFFGYLPMFGIIFAFKEQIRPDNWFYDLLVSPLVLTHLESIFTEPAVLTAIGNTLTISGLKLLIYFPFFINQRCI